MLKDLLELIKLRQTLLLIMSLYAGFYMAGGHKLPLLSQAIVGLLAFASIASTTAINMVFDVDIDSIMTRTRNRPLPRKRFNPNLVFIASLLVFVLSVIASLILVNTAFASLMLLGFVFDVLVYTLLTKRRSWLNIVFGSVAGAAPIMGGYAAVKGVVDLNAVLLGLLILTWIPAHTWLLAVHYLDDYMKAHVPMLPVVYGYKTALVVVAIFLAINAVTAYMLLAGESIGLVCFAIGFGLTIYTMFSLLQCRPKACLKQFKVANTILMFYLVGLILKLVA